MNIRGWLAAREHAAFIVVLLGLALFQGSAVPTSAQAQVTDPSSAEIKDDAHFAAYMAAKIDGHVKQVRTAVYVSLALSLVGLLASAYLLMRRRVSTALGGTEMMRPVLFRWSGGTSGLRRLHRRQKQLARAIADLQNFADQVARNNDEMSSLLAALQQQMKSIDKGLDEHAARPS